MCQFVNSKSPFRERHSYMICMIIVYAGNGCDRRQFQCGGDQKKCISDLLVCDGSNDCANGYDEDPGVCGQ